MIKRQPESARWRQEPVDKLKIDPSNIKPKSATVVHVANSQLSCDEVNESA